MPIRRAVALAVTALAGSAAAAAAMLLPTSGEGDITSKRGDAKTTLASKPRLEPFDLVLTRVRREGTRLVFAERVVGKAGSVRPTATGQLAGSTVFSYVWPTSLDPATVGFEGGTGTLALAATAHPDFDDTPRYDENGDGDPKNDGVLWHSHWVVLVPDAACGAGALKVRDIPPGQSPKVPATWPGLPLFLDSPGYEPELAGEEIRVGVPLKELGFPATFNYDGVTAALRVNASVHSPLLCVADVFDVASGKLDLPGRVEAPRAASR